MVPWPAASQGTTNKVSWCGHMYPLLSLFVGPTAVSVIPCLWKPTRRYDDLNEAVGHRNVESWPTFSWRRKCTCVENRQFMAFTWLSRSWPSSVLESFVLAHMPLRACEGLIKACLSLTLDDVRIRLLRKGGIRRVTLTGGHQAGLHM